jgi:hypothetical protein
VARRSATPVLVAAAIGFVWAVVASPVLLPTVAELRRDMTEVPPASATVRGSADLLSLILPSPRQTWWGGWSGRLGDRVWSPPIERAIFLGYLPLALAGLAARWDWRRARVWVLVALAFLLLALGPTLQVGGASAFGATGWSAPLPYRLLQPLPGLSNARIPARFGLVATLCLAVLAGLALVQLARRFPRVAGPRARLVLLPALVAALLAEHLTAPYPLERPSPPPFYQQLAGSPEQGAILEWPNCRRCSRSNYFQTVHGRPIIGGYVSRRLHYPIGNLPPYRALRAPGSDIFAGDDFSGIEAWVLRYSGVRWVVVYLDDPQFNPERDREVVPPFVRRAAEPAPLYEDERMVVYRPLPPGPPAHFVEARTGWYDREPLPGGRGWMRWFATTAAMSAWTFGETPQPYALRFDAWSYHQPRRLEVRVDGRVLGQWRVTSTQRFDIPLTLGMGEHWIELRALDPPVSPLSVGDDDPRPLAFAISRVELRR